MNAQIPLAWLGPRRRASFALLRRGSGTEAPTLQPNVQTTADPSFKALASSLGFDVCGPRCIRFSFPQVHLALRLAKAKPKAASRRSSARPARVEGS